MAITPKEFLTNVLENQDELEWLLENDPAGYRRLSEALSEPLATRQPLSTEQSDEGPF